MTPIDVLIIEMGLTYGSLNPEDVASIMGEDETNIKEWLDKLAKKGLFTRLSADEYKVRRIRAEEYLDVRSKPIP